MTKTKIEVMEFEVPSGPLGVSLITPKEKGEKLAVVLPGAGYSIRGPLLYYAIQILLEKGMTVLAINKVYGDDPKWLNLATQIEALQMVEEDACEFFRQVKDRFADRLDTVVARSLGTYALACAIEKGLAYPRQIVWQTPALKSKWPIMRSCGIRGFGLMGTADPLYEFARNYLPEDHFIVELANHGMEIEDDAMRTIEVLRQVTLATSRWLLT